MNSILLELNGFILLDIKTNSRCVSNIITLYGTGVHVLLYRYKLFIIIYKYMTETSCRVRIEIKHLYTCFIAE